MRTMRSSPRWWYSILTVCAACALGGMATLTWPFGDRYTQAQMEAAVEQVIADAPEWRDRGIALVGAHPRRDRKGIVVIVEQVHPDTKRRLDTHYESMTLFVEERRIAIPTLPPATETIIVPRGGLEPPQQCESMHDCFDTTR
jgi:hypothetical protein